jgi:hypothetical protein
LGGGGGLLWEEKKKVAVRRNERNERKKEGNTGREQAWILFSFQVSDWGASSAKSQICPSLI